MSTTKRVLLHNVIVLTPQSSVRITMLMAILALDVSFHIELFQCSNIHLNQENHPSINIIYCGF